VKSFPSTWQHGTLGEFFETVTGGTPPKSQKHYYGEAVPFVKPPELLDDFIVDAPDNLSDEGAAVARILPLNSILVSCIGNLGKIGINSCPVAFNQQINAMKPNHLSIPMFMFYQALSPSFNGQLHNLASGTTVPIVNKSKFNSINIVLPPIPEQQRIVTLLDDAFARIATATAHAEQNLKNARELFDSTLNTIFTEKGEGWVEKTIGDVLNLEYGKGLDKVKRNPEGKYPAYGANGIKDKTDEYLYDKATIIVGRKGSAGELTLTTDKFWALDVTYYVVFDESKYEMKFIYYLLSLLDLPSLAAWVKPGINRNNVYSIAVIIPSIDEQKIIIEKLDTLATKTKHLEALYQQKLAALAELKQSLLQQAFAGDL